MGYERADGSVGIRNYILVLSMVNCSNTVAQQIAAKTGAHVIPIDCGCVEVADHHRRTCLALTAAALNPNVYAAVLVGLGCEQTDHDKILADIAASGKPVSYIGIQECGGPQNAVAKGIAMVESYQAQAAALPRKEFPLSKMVLAVQCGGSDWTTALSGNITIGEMTDLVVEEGGSVIIGEVPGFPGSEHILAERSVTPQVGLEVIQMCDELRAEYVEAHGQTIEEMNPTPGNKAGGITTLEEKSLGCIHKGGHSIINEVYDYGKQVKAREGLVIMDTPGNDPASVAAMAAGGAQVVVFSSGRGSPIGSPIVPVVKITGNKITFANMEDNIDFNAAPLIYGERTVEELGQDLLAMVVETANGRQTKAEALGYTETAIARLCNYV